MDNNIITAPGVYDLTTEQYDTIRTPKQALRSSVAKILLRQTAAHAWTAHPRLNPNFEIETNKKFDRGNCCHELLLRGSANRIQVISGFDDWRKKEAQERRAAAYADGMIPMLDHEIAAAREMHAAALQQLAGHRDSADIFTDGAAEKTLVWKETVRGQEIWLQVRLDFLPNQARERVFGDFKSLATNVNPDILHRYAFSADWDFQEAFYRRGVTAVLGIEQPRFKFVVQECDPPYALVVVDFPPEAKDYADSKVEQAIDYWAWCLAKNAWPAYPAFTCTLEVPPWIGTEFEAQKVRRQRALKDGRELYEDMIKMQAPL